MYGGSQPDLCPASAQPQPCPLSTMPLSIETLRELAKLTELKSKGGIPDHHFDLLKQHIKETGTLTREAWEVFGLAWNLKVDAVLTAEEYAEQIEEGVASILSSRVGAPLLSGSNGVPQAAGTKSPAGSKKTKKTKKAAAGEGSAKKRGAAGGADGSSANASSTGPVSRREEHLVCPRASARVWRHLLTGYRTALEVCFFAADRFLTNLSENIKTVYSFILIPKGPYIYGYIDPGSFFHLQHADRSSLPASRSSCRAFSPIFQSQRTCGTAELVPGIQYSKDMENENGAFIHIRFLFLFLYC